MDRNSLHAEAEYCRRQALTFFEGPENQFLVRLAQEFDRLAQMERRGKSSLPDCHPSGRIA